MLKAGEPPLTEPGDSGSLVYDSSSGEVVGIFFAASDLHGHFYFTPILDVFRDIKRVTGAVNVRIA
jgi:V8-like Glu-specific endopeptidase